MIELPLGWAWSTLGDVTDVVSGSTPSTANRSYWDGDIPWITPDDLSKDRSKRIARGARLISRAGYESCSTRLVPAGTVLYTSRAPIGYVAIAANPVCTNQGFKSFVPSETLTSDYLYWFFQHATPAIRRLGSGTTFPELSKARAREITIPIPPLAEQKRIVAHIEAHLSRLDVAVASLRAALARTDAMVASATVRAVRGEWPVVQLRDITVQQEYGTSAKADREGDVAVLRMGNLRDGELDFGDLKYLPVEHPDATRFQLAPGDLLFNRTNSPELVGKSAVFRGADRPVAFASYLIRVRLIEECVPDWAALVINSPLGRAYIARVRTQQVGQANVNGSKLAAMPIPLPPAETQRKLLADVDAYRGQARQLRLAIDGGVRQSDSLRRSILARAFRGELIPQDPDDEPASVVLERVAAERAVAPKPTRKARQTATA